MSALAVTSLFLSAALLFSMQPMLSRMGLPMLGGAPSVWNTSMVFFQAAVLMGYGLADVLARVGTVRLQAWVFVGLIAGGWVVQPLRLGGAPMAPGDSPAGWLLGRLLVSAGLPALALSMAAPLLQRWFHGRTGRDPYFLYVASNLGSLGALMAYPFWVEPWLGLAGQAEAWRWGYLVWGVMVLAMGMASGGRGAAVASARGGEAAAVGGAPGMGKLGLWALMGAIPASLLQGCTMFLTTDIASVPLLWVVPLATYLGTFVLTFDVGMRRPVALARRALPYLGVSLLLALLTRATQPVGLLMALHLGFLLAAGLACHGRLVEERPAAGHLTRFYLALAAGGVAGGAFNSLVAPQVFRSMTEYPLAISLACGVGLAGAGMRWAWKDAGVAALLGGGVLLAGGVADGMAGGHERLRDAGVFGLAALACWCFKGRPHRFGLAMLAVFGAGGVLETGWSRNEATLRNFFGITRVTRDAGGKFRQLMHGNTFHGRQHLEAGLRSVPLTYYHPQGPVGDVFRALRGRAGEGEGRGLRIGVIGLGVGSLCAYGQPGDSMTFYEIDPAVIEVAGRREWFSYVAESPSGPPRIVVGDGRLRLMEERDARYDLLVLDAFSSDSIPVHLLTVEAFALYRARLAPGGVLLVHVSNRYLGLEPVVAAAAAALGMTSRGNEDDNPTAAGQEASHWVLVASQETDLGMLRRSVQWKACEAGPGARPWTDERASLWSAWKW